MVNPRLERYTQMQATFQFVFENHLQLTTFSPLFIRYYSEIICSNDIYLRPSFELNMNGISEQNIRW